jgi:transposase
MQSATQKPGFESLEIPQVDELEWLRAQVLSYQMKLVEKDQALVEKDQALVEKDQALVEKDQALVEKDRVIDQKAKRIDWLMEQLKLLRQLKFGRSSEHFNPEQQQLFGEDVSADIAAVETELEAASVGSELSDVVAPKPARAKPVRQALPAHLPREETILPDLCACLHCGSTKLHPRGEEVSEKLAVQPAVYYVQRTIRRIMTCRDCEAQSYPATPAEIIDGGMADASLLAQVLIDKYVDHLPLYRLIQRYARSGVELSISTLSDWVGQCGVALQPLCDRLRVLMQQAAAIHVDETPVTVLNVRAQSAQESSKQAYVFAYRSADINGTPIVLFDFQSSRKGVHAEGFLGNYAGALVVDDFSGYKRLFAESERQVINQEIACFAHARRKFFELHQANKSELANEALIRIGELYEIERQGKDLDAEARYQLRQSQSKPKLDALIAWLETKRAHVNNGSGIAKAIDYLMDRKASFRTFLTDGRFPIDNNPVENAIRPIALGRKNWLFAGSPRAGQRAAAIMSLVATAKAQGLDPHAYLTEVLRHLPSTKDKDIDTLLPMAFAAKLKNTA